MGRGLLSVFLHSWRSATRPRESAATGDVDGPLNLGYQPALDGIRALAVLAVLCFHAELSWAQGGFLGVDTFFVLSGFLITALLLEEWRSSGNVRLRAFWARRARRLLPALYVVLLAIGVCAVLFADKSELENFRGDVVAVLAGISNWWPLVLDRRQYFFPVSHLWSLSIEQQWYFVWPFVVVGVLSWRRGSLRALLLVTIALMLASALRMVTMYHGQKVPVKIYLETDTRAQSLLAGAALALLLAQGWRWVHKAMSSSILEITALGCAIGVIAAWGIIPQHDPFLYRSGYLWFSIAVAVIIAAAMQANSRILAPFLVSPPLRRLGLISYSVYLWHVPLFWVLTPNRTLLDGYSLFAVRLASTILISIITYKLIETPFRKGALRAWRADLLLAPFGGLVVGVFLFFLIAIRY